MIKVYTVVQSILLGDIEASTALTKGYMNLSKYAQQIHSEVEEITKKEVGLPVIVVALSRISKSITLEKLLVQDVEIKNITTKSPLTELVYKKTSKSVSKLANVYALSQSDSDDFFAMTLSTNEISVICSNRIKHEIQETLQEKPIIAIDNLASIGLAIDPKYYPQPNITFSLIRKIAQNKIALAETITTRTEIIFVLDQKHLSEVVGIFTANETWETGL